VARHGDLCLALGLAVIALALVTWVWLRGPARVDARIVGPTAEA